MKKIMIVLVAVVLVLIAGMGAFFWYSMSRPLYEPGMVRAGQNLRASLIPPKQSADENFWTMESDIQLYHYSYGAGRNVLVVHGGPSIPISKPLPGLEPLTGNYRFVYYDQRGCGKSSRPIVKFSSPNYYENMTTLDKTLGIGAQVADIEQIRQIIGEEKLILIGHSFGAFLASLYAAEFPEHVQALILVAPADVLVMPQADGGLFEQVGQFLPDNLRSQYAAYLKNYFDYSAIFSKTEADLAALNGEFSKYYAAAARKRNFQVPASEMGESGGWVVQAMYFSMGRQHDYRAALKQVKAPALVIHGANDLQSEQASRMYANAFPNSTFRIIMNAGHFSFDDQPEEFARVTGEFLNRAAIGRISQ